MLNHVNDKVFYLIFRIKQKGPYKWITRSIKVNQCMITESSLVKMIDISSKCDCM